MRQQTVETDGQETDQDAPTCGAEKEIRIGNKWGDLEDDASVTVACDVRDGHTGDHVGSRFIELRDGTTADLRLGWSR